MWLFPPRVPPPQPPLPRGRRGGGGGGCLSRSQIKMRQRNAFRVTPKLSSQNRGPRRSGHRDEGDTGTGAGRGGDTRAPGAGGRRRHRLRPSDARPGLAAIAPELRGMNGAAVGSVGTAAGAEGRRRGGGGGGLPGFSLGYPVSGGCCCDRGGVPGSSSAPAILSPSSEFSLWYLSEGTPKKHTPTPPPPRCYKSPGRRVPAAGFWVPQPPPPALPAAGAGREKGGTAVVAIPWLHPFIPVLPPLPSSPQTPGPAPSPAPSHPRTSRHRLPQFSLAGNFRLCLRRCT